MTERLPRPLTPEDCDCTDLDGFMLNVERLLGSELVALSSHEVIGAAVLVWARAWKQRPAASLPDDDKVNAAFARMPIGKYRKLKEEILRGFVKCSDGRLYHKVLAAEAVKAFGKKTAFRKKRESDAERLRRWRLGRGETADETLDETEFETGNETRFDDDGVVQDETRFNTRPKSKLDAADAKPIGTIQKNGAMHTRADTAQHRPHVSGSSNKINSRANGETSAETRFVAEGQGQGQGQKDSLQGSKNPGVNNLDVGGDATPDPAAAAGKPRVIAGGKP